MNAIKLYEKLADPGIASWLVTFILVWLLFRFSKDVIGAGLMVLYDFFILRSPVNG